MARVNIEALMKAEEEAINETEEKVLKLRASLHEYGILEAQAMGAMPSTLAAATVEHAAVSVVAAAVCGPRPNEFVLVMLGRFIQLLGDASGQPELANMGAGIIDQILCGQRQSKEEK